MQNDVTTFLAWVPAIEIAIAGYIYLAARQNWAGFEGKAEYDTYEERTLGASVIMGQLSALITGSSIILAGIGAFVALATKPIPFPENYHLVYAALWAVLSLGLALFTMSALPTQSPKRNFVQLRGVAILCVMGLFFALAAGVRFLFSVANLLIF